MTNDNKKQDNNLNKLMTKQYLTIHNEIIQKYKRCPFDHDSHSVSIKLPIFELKNIEVKVFIRIFKYNFSNCVLHIVCNEDFVKTLPDLRYRMLYNENIFYLNAYSIDNDNKDIVINQSQKEEYDNLSTKLMNIDFIEIYEILNNLKFDVSIGRFQRNLFCEEYTNEFLYSEETLDNCCVCYTKNIYKLACCNSHLCMLCMKQIVNKSDSFSWKCPICRDEKSPNNLFDICEF